MPKIIDAARNLPGWVQGWLVVLSVVNTASLFWVFHQPVARFNGLCMMLILPLNSFMFRKLKGLSRLMAVPHFVWFGLLYFIYQQLYIEEDGIEDPTFRTFCWILAITNGISLGFDVVDAFRYIVLGHRDVVSWKKRSD
eukprot:TRINITY_DN9571_c0_g2_i1.p2 TRINITY_DN9571_c0_g2~~TRINITY_DN9571_c0_g2_i1.p2  ORF type:complete len:139 (+),score=12.48 TRINITY_DN9571_c0_g2_i1:183-599(+)